MVSQNKFTRFSESWSLVRVHERTRFLQLLKPWLGILSGIFDPFWLNIPFESMRIFKSSLIFAPWSCCLMNPKPIRFKQVNNMKRYHPCQFVTGMIVSDRSISGLQCIRLGALSYGRHIPVKQYIHRLAQKKRIASPQYFNPYVSILTDHSTGPCISRQAFAFAWSGSQPNSPRKWWVVHGSKI